ncbi:hypothetical protein KXD40_005953 [Peronospora effusa]|nr:hypothetical protein KXD40_005953 [Peronospora effusa]
MFPYLLRKSHRMAADTKYCIYPAKLSLAKLHELKLCLLNYSISWFSTMIRRSQIFRRPHYYPFRRIRAVRLLLYSNRRGLAVSSIQQGRKLSLDFKIEMQSNAWLLRRSPTDILFVNMFPYLLRKSHRMAADTKYCMCIYYVVCVEVLMKEYNVHCTKRVFYHLKD